MSLFVKKVVIYLSITLTHKIVITKEDLNIAIDNALLDLGVLGVEEVEEKD